LPIEIKIDIDRAIQESDLTEMEFNCIILRYKHDYTQQEIADILNVSQTNVYIKLNEALAKITKIIEEK